jgi:hypothetical protein
VSNWSRDNQANATSGQKFYSTRVAALANPASPGSSLFELSFDAWVTDGVRFTIDTLPASLSAIDVALFYSDEIEAHAWSVPSPTTPQTVTTGWETSFILTSANHVASSGDRGVWQYGMATQTDMAVTGLSVNHGTAAGQSVKFHYDDRISITHAFSAVPGTVSGANIVTNFTSTSFDIDELSGAGPGPAQFGLAFSVGANVHLATSVTTRTTTGTKDYFEAGFKPEFIYIPVSSATANNSLAASATVCFAMFGGDDGDSPAVDTLFTREEHSADPTDNSDRVASGVLLHQRNHASDALVIEASLSSRSDSGFTLNYTTTTTPERFFSYLVIQREETVLRTGTSDGAATVAGTLQARGAAAGASAGAASTSGVLRAKGALAGAVAGSATTSATGLLRALLFGAVAGASTSSGAVKAKGALAGVVAGAAAVAATVRARAVIAGSAAGSAVVAGTARLVGVLRGAVAGAAIVVAVARGKGALAGLTSGAGTAAAVMSSRRRISGVAAGTATVTATGSGAPVAEVRGTVVLAGARDTLRELVGTKTTITALAGSRSVVS